MPDPEAAIGIFDSGVGGLTVARSVMARLPHERVVYLGDTARVPYGTKSPETVIRYARGCASLLMERQIKLLVVACNTASAWALEPLRGELEIPVLGVVEPGARAAVESTRNGRIGVIGTPGTIASGEYQQAIQAIAPETEVFYKACPLFVPLAEEGWTTGAIPAQVCEKYLADLIEAGVDTLVLGCTHYPLLKGVIAETMGQSTVLVDSAEATSKVVAEILEGMGIQGQDSGRPSHTFLVSDAPGSFMTQGRAFLGGEIENVEWVDF